ncbi:protein angel homolog 1 isoform X2 [Ambystoma mexicanum]|uniref:protein angel homolog 1 isoform X2 n=1 Tax=Ambystoma mexicanum TaxID=8296 RepID=UPI0037E7D116
MIGSILFYILLPAARALRGWSRGYSAPSQEQEDWDAGNSTVREQNVECEKDLSCGDEGGSVMSGSRVISPPSLRDEPRSLPQQYIGEGDGSREPDTKELEATGCGRVASGASRPEGQILHSCQGLLVAEVEEPISHCNGPVVGALPIPLADAANGTVGLEKDRTVLRPLAAHSVLDYPAQFSPLSGHSWHEDSAVLEWSLASTGNLEETSTCPSWNLQGLEQSLPEPIPYHEILWRDWEYFSLLTSCELNSGGVTQFEFTVMSYNILAQDLVQQSPELYLHCHPDILSWDYRYQNILQELQHWDPDILCLQEVQENHYYDQLEPVLESMGFTCFYKRRTGRKTDGCATCYKHDRFSLLCASPVEFFRPGIDVLNRDNIALVLLLQPLAPGQKGDSVEKETTATATSVCVANTHLLYNPRRGDIKLAQLALLLAEIDKVARTEHGSYCPVILCGDINSVPNSPLYTFIQNGKLCYQGMLAWKVSGQENCSHQPYQQKLPCPLWPSLVGITESCQYVSQFKAKKTDRLKYGRDFLLQFQFCEAACQRPPDLLRLDGVTDAKPVPPDDWSQRVAKVNTPDSEGSSLRAPGTIQHGLSLTSVYNHFLPAKGRAEVTTMPMGFGATVDYIFFSAEPFHDVIQGGRRPYRNGALRLIGRLSLLSEEDLWAAVGLPNPFCSSDHLCLLARFGMDLATP